MTSPERKLTDEQVAAWASDRGRDVAVAQLAREVIESRRLAPLHAAAVALGDDVESSIVREPGSVHHMHGDAAFLSAGISWSSVTAYRAARRALEPQPMQHNDNLRIVREEAEVAVEGDSSQFQHWLILRPGDKVSVIRAKPALESQPDEDRVALSRKVLRQVMGNALAGDDTCDSMLVELERFIDAKLAALGRAGK